jgi:transposase
MSNMYFLGRKCLFCNKYGMYRLKDKRVKCNNCKKKYSINKIRRHLLILYYFYLEVSARKTANETDLNYETVQSRFNYFRECIMKYSDKEDERLKGELELDESYFGGKKKGKRGRGAGGKTIVFGILERKGEVHTIIVPDVSADTLMKKIKKKTKKGSVFYTDTWKSYNSLNQYGKHNTINHSNKDYVDGHNHINGIEGFWSFAKERFHKYHGIHKKYYPLYLKEMEFRYNNRNRNVYSLLFDLCIRRCD